MASGSSLPWDRLISETTGLAPSAQPLLAFFRPLQLRQPEEPARLLRTLELEGEFNSRHGTTASAHAGS